MDKNTEVAIRIIHESITGLTGVSGQLGNAVQANQQVLSKIAEDLTTIISYLDQEGALTEYVQFENQKQHIKQKGNIQPPS